MPDALAPAAVAPTGITGLDHLLRGGLPANRLYMLLGDPGAGKTTLAMQFLLEGARRGESGLYIALSETHDEISSVARSHGWSLDGVDIFELSALEQQLAEEAQNTIFRPSEIELNRTTDLLLERIGRTQPRRLVLDSLSELRLLSDTALRYRRQMLSLKQYFASRQITVLLLDDHSADGGDLHVQSIAHGVLAIEQVISDYGAPRRRIRISKLRGLDFVGGYHDAAVVPGGLKVFPRLIAGAHRPTHARGLMRSGLAPLDSLVGGGLDRGTSCLLLGPAGTGKSTLTLQFAAAAVARGDKVLMCLFEENLGTMMARASSVGLPVEASLASGAMTIRETIPGELTPGEFIHHVITQVREKDIRVVVIDSLNGYLQALPDAKALNLQLHELLAFLNARGVLSLITVAQHGLIGHMQAPVDLTYLADTVILLRYFEQAGRILKAISVIKKRIGRHEDTIREFRIDGGGLRVGEPLEEFHGVLTGTPVFQGDAGRMLTERPGAAEPRRDRAPGA